LGAGIKVAMDFEGAMKEIEVRAGLTAEELDEVSAYALQMGKTTAFSGEEAADGLLQLLTSGNDLKESMELLKPVMDLAASSNLELGYSADATTDIMAMFGLTTNDAVDAWFTGYHPTLATAVWMGYDKPRSLGGGASGGALALPIWIDFMGAALKAVPVVQPPAPPAGLSRVNDEWLYTEWVDGGGWVSSISDAGGTQYAGPPTLLDALNDLFKP